MSSWDPLSRQHSFQPGSDIISDGKLERLGCGSLQEKSAVVEDVDLHAVTLLSDCSGAHPVTEAER